MQYTCYEQNCVACENDDRRRLSELDPKIAAACEAQKYTTVSDCQEDCKAPPSPPPPPSPSPSPPHVFACIDHKCEDCNSNDRRRLDTAIGGGYANSLCNRAAADLIVQEFFDQKTSCEQSCRAPPPPPSPPLRYVCHDYNCLSCEDNEDRRRRRLVDTSDQLIWHLCNEPRPQNDIFNSYGDCTLSCQEPESPSPPPPPPSPPPAPPTYYACVDDSCVTCDEDDRRRRLDLLDSKVSLACETARYADIDDCKSACVSPPSPPPPPSPMLQDRFVCGRTACHLCDVCDDDDRRRLLAVASPVSLVGPASVVSASSVRSMRPEDDKDETGETLNSLSTSTVTMARDLERYTVYYDNIVNMCNAPTGAFLKQDTCDENCELAADIDDAFEFSVAAAIEKAAAQPCTEMMEALHKSLTSGKDDTERSWNAFKARHTASKLRQGAKTGFSASTSKASEHKFEFFGYATGIAGIGSAGVFAVLVGVLRRRAQPARLLSSTKGVVTTELKISEPMATLGPSADTA